LTFLDSVQFVVTAFYGV